MAPERFSLVRVARSLSILSLVLAAGMGACGDGVDESSPASTTPSSSTNPSGSDAGSNPKGPTAAQPSDAAVDDGVVVAHDRELRGAWIATVHNSTWPSKPGLDQTTAKAELVKILDALASAHMNTVFFQVRTESDALYASTLEPWSRWLTGTQGEDPGWDPLAFTIEEGHKRGLEVHAWLNPYRALTTTTGVNNQVAANQITKTMPTATVTYGTSLWMDPGSAEVRAHILAVIGDILNRYDVDGIHFDDYFYPYPEAGSTFDDAATYAKYTGAGGVLGKDDWRRANVNTLVSQVNDLVTKTRADVRFGISPFGIYRPGTPAGITGLDAYAAIYCDSLKWMNEGWVDYLAPQLYWPTTQTAQAFGKLATWWASIAKDGRAIFIGQDVTKAGQGAFTLAEYDAEMDIVRSERPHGALGSIFFSASGLVADQAGVRTELATKYFTTPSATPPLASASALKEAAAAKPVVTTNAKHVVITNRPLTRSVAVYRQSGGGSAYTLDRLVPPTAGATTELDLDVGGWALSAIDRRGVESRAAPVAIK